MAQVRYGELQNSVTCQILGRCNERDTTNDEGGTNRENRNTCDLVGKPEGKNQLRRPGYKENDCNKLFLKRNRVGRCRLHWAYEGQTNGGLLCTGLHNMRGIA